MTSAFKRICQRFRLSPNIECVRRGYTIAALAALASCVWAQTPAYYYQGRHKVQVEIRTDAIAVESTAPVAVTQKRIAGALVAVASPVITSVDQEKNIVSVQARNLAELSESARRLKKALPDAKIQAILTAPNSRTTTPGKFLTAELSFQLSPGTSIKTVTSRYKLSKVRPASYARDTYIAEVANSDDITAALTTANAMQESGDVMWATPVIEQQRVPRAVPNDPLFPSQWHLRNTGTNTLQGRAGNDLNVVPAWDVATGLGVNIAINDDGVETTHTDLAANIRSDLDHDFNNEDDDPGPLPKEAHGTGCAGVSAGRSNNGIGITGVAPDAGIVGLRILSAPITDQQEASSLAWKAPETVAANQAAINSNSWGPPDTGDTLEGPNPLTEEALQFGTSVGRNGKGIVYTWAAGNGRTNFDNINKDGFASSPWVIAVGASNSTGTYSWYSEPGSAMLINAPSSHNSDGIVTTDISGAAGDSPTSYRSDFGGTSSAAPAVAGVVALMLQANPLLTYRDVMHILVETAVPNDPTAPEWETNGAGHPFNHNYGFGRVDAAAAVNAAVAWDNVPELAAVIDTGNILTAPVGIPDNSTTGVILEIPVRAPANFKIEHVELEANIVHELRGDVAILLQSPSGMISELMDASNDFGDNFSNWRFRSVAHWDEPADGTWRVLFADLFEDAVGSVTSLTLRIQGYQTATSAVDSWELY